MSEPLPSFQRLGDATRLILQGTSALCAPAGECFGVPIPENAHRAHAKDGRAALWLGPEEWLLLAPAGDEQEILAAIEERLAGIPHSLVDVSHRQLALSVSGPGVRDLLNCGCPLDLDPEAFPVGACTRTLLGKAEVVLWRRAAEEYHLEIGRSFSGYVLAWLGEGHRGG